MILFLGLVAFSLGSIFLTQVNLGAGVAYFGLGIVAYAFYKAYVEKRSVYNLIRSNWRYLSANFGGIGLIWLLSWISYDLMIGIFFVSLAIIALIVAFMVMLRLLDEWKLKTWAQRSQPLDSHEFEELLPRWHYDPTRAEFVRLVRVRGLLAPNAEAASLLQGLSIRVEAAQGHAGSRKDVLDWGAGVLDELCRLLEQIDMKLADRPAPDRSVMALT